MMAIRDRSVWASWRRPVDRWIEDAKVSSDPPVLDAAGDGDVSR
jgi:hypothetical protein